MALIPDETRRAIGAAYGQWADTNGAIKEIEQEMLKQGRQLTGREMRGICDKYLKFRDDRCEHGNTPPDPDCGCGV